MRWSELATKTRKTVFSVFESVSAVLIMVVTAAVILRIMSRQVSIPLTGYAEYAQAMVIWIIFLGIGRAAYYGDDIRSDWVLEKLPDRIESALRNIILVVSAAAMAIMTAAAFLVSLEFKARTTPGAGIPFPILHGALLFGSTVLLVVYLAQIFKGLRSALGGVA
jgi:TRAP-type C4-dicarboxylate transport system permease small subunit